ncbi:MarR family transcriptional regulator [Paracoccus sp. (in: a-proteobacteria)]|uniref:MarR family winged helix-turn-helix transcriptional regulator n=1 Tax=Paracoccus sp. TaxID=267 RepID=UPI0032206E9F
MKHWKDQSAGYLVNHVARLFARGLTEAVRPFGLTTGTFPALLELWQQDGLTQKQLVERLDIEQATMANTLARMERDGLITRQRAEADRRMQHIFLTERARRLQAPAIEAATAVNASLLAGLGPDDRHQFIRLMQKIISGQQ